MSKEEKRCIRIQQSKWSLISKVKSCKAWCIRQEIESTKMSSHARTPPPRPLGAKETLESLTHWKTTFRTFYKRDYAYKLFIKEEARWDPSDEDYYGQVDEDGDSPLKRKKAEMKEDLLDLLNTLSGYLPHSYLTDKILKSTKGWKEVWNLIHNHYVVQVTSESLLDFESLQKQTGGPTASSLNDCSNMKGSTWLQ